MRKCTTVALWVALGVWLGILWSGVAIAQDTNATGWVSRIVSLQGKVLVKRLGENRWMPVQLNENFSAGDQIQVGANSRAGVVLKNDAVLRLDQNTTLMFIEIEKETSFILKLLKGAANFFSRRPRSLNIQTPFVNGVVEGTEFFVQVDDNQTRIDLFEGRILAENEAGSLLLEKGQGATASAGREPARRILVQPRESVQWALYYPFVVDRQSTRAMPEVERSWDLFQKGRMSEALSALEQIDSGDRDALYLIYRAGLLLHVGRVPEAENDLQRALERDPDNGNALALQSVIAVVQNRTEEAIAIAERAVAQAPLSATAYIALSYALQSNFKLPEALEAAQKAVEHSPENGLAWARLAELQLSVGKLDHGERSAQKAVELNPLTAGAQTTLGYAYLTRIRIDDARDAFQKAIAMDSADPLPRLGLGLAQIRKGNLAEGRREIEIAAGLDPGRSLIRSYLGKAYFDEKRGPLDAKQFDIAKALDPNDPTPWFYDAIRKQTENRPVEALRDLQKSIELNDNRAVYRSRLLLDQDLASRSASLGRIYSDLGFEQLALVEGWKSVNTEPSNPSGHRLLADTYMALPRHDIARVSELLQSQLLQPLNINPVQPQLAEINLRILEGAGPTHPSFNEFNPLFERNRLALQVSGVVGENETYGDELAQSGLWNNFSYSLGQFHYQTEGFRENNELENNIYNAYMQMALSPTASLQAEYRYRDAESGDLHLNFNPDDYSTIERRDIQRHTARLGLHYQPVFKHHLLASFIYRDLDDEISEQEDFVSPEYEYYYDYSTRSQSNAYTAEVQYHFPYRWSETIAGGGYFDEDKTDDDFIRIEEVLPPVDPSIDSQSSSDNIDTMHANAYLYSNIQVLENMTWSVGLSYDNFSSDRLDRDSFNPKMGLVWELLPQTTFRAAAFRTLKRPFASNQTVEPTQVAGFNQFFDDLDASKSERYGFAIDQEFTSRLAGGVEFSWRDVEMPVYLVESDEEGKIVSVESQYEKQDEQFHRVYLYWAPSNVLSLNSELQYELFDRILTDYSDAEEPERIETYRFPVGVNYFLPIGLYAKCKATYVNQEVEALAGGANAGKEHFWVVDATVGYRLPRRRGLVSIGVKNLFDEEFRFQDVNFQSGEPLNPMFQPCRVALFKLTLSF